MNNFPIQAKFSRVSFGNVFYEGAHHAALICNCDAQKIYPEVARLQEKQQVVCARALDIVAYLRSVQKHFSAAETDIHKAFRVWLEELIENIRIAENRGYAKAEDLLPDKIMWRASNANAFSVKAGFFSWMCLATYFFKQVYKQ